MNNYMRILMNNFVIKKSIFNKVFLIMFSQIIIIFFLFVIYSFFNRKEILFDNLNFKANNIANSILLSCQDAIVQNNNRHIIEYNLEYLKRNPHIKYLVIVKKDNTHLYLEHNKWLYNEEIDTKYLNNYTNIEMGQIIDDEFNKKSFIYSFPVILSGLEWGKFYISLDLEEYTLSLHELYRDSILFFLFSFLFSLFGAYIIAFFFTKPILHLKNVAKYISEGDLSQRIDFKRNDELGELADTLNLMVKNLYQAKKDLVQNNTKLELKVRIRTKEIQLKNKQLEELNNSLDEKIRKEIYKRKEQEQILIHQSRLAAMGEMTSMIAHQWRQPLNAIGLRLQNIQLLYDLNRLEEKNMKDMISQSFHILEKMSTTIDDFKDFFEPNKIKKEFVVYKMIESTFNLVDVTFSSKNIKVTIEHSNLKIYTYENELSQVILNIFSNAKDALIERNIKLPKINVDITQDDNYVIVFIEDNAGGVPDNIINKIFEPYFSTKTQKNGMGIGLYMSKMIIERNIGGKLTVNNGIKGAKFNIYLPKNNQ